MMVLWTSSQLFAQDFTVDGINYQVTSQDDKTCKVYWSWEASGDIVIPPSVSYNGVDYSVTELNSDAFANCKELTSIQLPETITTIGWRAFSYCTSLTEITILSSITEINPSTFENCSSLTRITLPESITTIGESAFRYCESLTSVELPSSLTTIGTNAFRESGLKSIDFPESLTRIEMNAFQGCKDLASVNFSEGLTFIGEGAFADCTSLVSVDLPASVTTLTHWAFDGCTSLTSVILPKNLTTLESCFESCTSLTTVVFPEVLEEIGNNLFRDCSTLTTVTLPKSLKSIGENAFQGTGLTSLDLPATLESIGKKAFMGCPDIRTVTMHSGNPQDIQCDDCFDEELYTTAPLRIPDGTLNNYIATAPWSKFINIESIHGEKVTLEEPEEDIIAGNSMVLTATVTGGSGSALTWTSSDAEVATVDNTGKVTGVGEGSAWISAASANARSMCEVKVILIHAETIELNKSEATIENGKTLELTATISPEEHSDKVEWSSDNEEVATVDQNGLVTAVGAGTATITVQAGTVKAECKVTVVISATAIALDKEEATIEKGKTLDLVATVTPEDTTDEIIWSSEDESVATVDQTGKVTAVNKGTVLITVTAGNVSATCEITVVIPATDIALDKEEATIEKGETLTLEVTVVPEDTTDELVWSSSDEAVATVENGVVTAVAPGTATITVTAGAVSATCEVTVVISATDIALDKEEATIEKGETLTLEVTVVPEDTTDELVWSSSDEAVATVENGVVTAVAPGTATITVTAGEVSATCEVTVVISATGITLDKEDATIEKGETLTLEVTVVPEDTTDELVWSSSDEAVATVEDGVVTAVAPGTATITVTAGEVSATCEVTVVISMTGIELDKEEADGYIGGTVQLTATVVPEDTTDDTTVIWTSSDEEVATVDENGLVTCLAEGTVVITATCGEFSAECTVTVVDRPPFVGITSLELSAEEIELALNFTYSLFAYITPENATDRELEWSSSNLDVARVDENGVVCGVVPGEAVITAKTTDGSNLSASCKFTIVATSGIDGTYGDGVKVTVSAGVITVAGASVGDIVEVYSMSGACIVAKGIESSVEEIPVAASGVYVVRVAGKTFKVAL